MKKTEMTEREMEMKRRRRREERERERERNAPSGCLEATHVISRGGAVALISANRYKVDLTMAKQRCKIFDV